MLTLTQPETHEAFIHFVRAIVAPRIPDAATRERIINTKLVYGAGSGGVRGVTYYGAWQNGHHGDFLEVCASGEESPVQLVGTTLHEIAHALTGAAGGHGAEWKASCKVLGLNHAEAAGQSYAVEHFDTEVWRAVSALDAPTDGRPTFTTTRGTGGIAIPLAPRPCRLGIGTRGGKSRGAGSGSRLRKWMCSCGVIARVASDTFEATCSRCGSAFVLVGKEKAPNEGRRIQAAAENAVGDTVSRSPRSRGTSNDGRAMGDWRDRTHSGRRGQAREDARGRREGAVNEQTWPGTPTGKAR